MPLVIVRLLIKRKKAFIILQVGFLYGTSVDVF